MSWRGADRRSSTRRWEDESWTRGEQARFEEELQKLIGDLSKEIRRQGDRLTRVLTGVGIAAFVAPLVVTAALILFGGA